MAATNNPPTQNGNDVLDEISAKAPEGTVLPPRGVRPIVEKLAGYVVRNGANFEGRVRESQGHRPQTSFLNPEDAYHAYYRWRVQEIEQGRGTSISAGRQGEEVSFRGREERKGPEKPEEFAFSARMPNISAQDLEVVKLTALFAAKNGRSWTTALAQREAGNYQFDFLRPQHSMYQFWDRLVEQYKDLLNGENVDGGRPQKKRIAELEANVQNRFHVLERAKKRAEWVKFQQAQKVAKEELDEKEQVAYAQIDWHDFVVVETVVFDERDEGAELPAPSSKNDLQSASLEQKAAMSINPSRRIEEAMPSLDDYEQFYGQAAAMPQAQQQSYTPQPQSTISPPPQQVPSQPAQQDDPTSRAATLQADRARARAAQEAAKAQPAAVKIRHDYIPAALQSRAKHAPTSLCPNCHLPIPNDEMAQHLRVEMLDPQWRDQNRINQQRSSTTNLSTADVAKNLKRLASQRADVFDPVTGEEKVGGEERERRRRRELGSWDGVSVVPNPAALAGMGGGLVGEGRPAQVPATTPADVQEQIRLIHERARKG